MTKDKQIVAKLNPTVNLLLDIGEDHCGWNDNTKLFICQEFIEQNKLEEKFAKFVEDKIGEELDHIDWYK